MGKERGGGFASGAKSRWMIVGEQICICKVELDAKLACRKTPLALTTGAHNYQAQVSPHNSSATTTTTPPPPPSASAFPLPAKADFCHNNTVFD